MSIVIQFQPWRTFHAVKRPDVVQTWLQGVADRSKQAFVGGMGSYPPASSPGAWPNVRSGGLRGSVSTEVTSTEATVGSNMFYSIFLRAGTSKMARRKMSDDALKEGMEGARLGHWVEWSRAA